MITMAKMEIDSINIELPKLEEEIKLCSFQKIQMIQKMLLLK